MVSVPLRRTIVAGVIILSAALVASPLQRRLNPAPQAPPVSEQPEIAYTPQPAAASPQTKDAAASKPAVSQRPDPEPKPGVNLAAQLQADFQKRIDEYVKLHKKVEATMPKLSKESTPEEIDKDQRALEGLIAAERADARPGDIFGPGMQAFVKALLADVFKGAQGAQAKKAIYYESHPVRPAINKRYPDDIPLSTMPPRVLGSLPKLPDELEYRFVNDDLILMDVHAHIIVDYILNAMPTPPPPNAPK